LKIYCELCSFGVKAKGDIHIFPSFARQKVLNFFFLVFLKNEHLIRFYPNCYMHMYFHYAIYERKKDLFGNEFSFWCLDFCLNWNSPFIHKKERAIKSVGFENKSSILVLHQGEVFLDFIWEIQFLVPIWFSRNLGLYEFPRVKHNPINIKIFNCAWK